MKINLWSTQEDLTTHWRYTAIAELDEEQNKRTKYRFHKWMCNTFGPPENRWSIRWTLFGVDVKFHEHKDFVTFSLFYTKNG